MENIIKFIVVDDSLLDQLAVVEFSKKFPELINIGCFDNASDALIAFQDIKPDLVFLDIEMPEFNGIELLSAIKSRVPMAVFVTSHAEFAIDAYELAALDYILKPLTAERFNSCMVRVLDFWAMKNKALLYETLFEKEYIKVKESHNEINIPLLDIIYLEAMQDYTKIVTNSRRFMTLTPLTHFLSRLPGNDFIRIHRSYAVARKKIVELRSTEIMCGNNLLPIGKTYRSAVLELLKN